MPESLLEEAEEAFKESVQTIIETATDLKNCVNKLFAALKEERAVLVEKKLRFENISPQSTLIEGPSPQLDQQVDDGYAGAWEPLQDTRFKPIDVFAASDAIKSDLASGAGLFTGYQVNIGTRTYSVLPPHPADSTKASHDMCDKSVLVPDGWEILSTSMDDFDDIIKILTRRGWGTLRLCVQDKDGLASYATPLRRFGDPGEKLTEHSAVLSQDASNPRKFNFNSSRVSGRLVVRSVPVPKLR